jgi:hypothetical protein
MATSTPPAIRSADMVMPNISKMTLPATLKSTTTNKAVSTALRAMARRTSGRSPAVSAMKIGVAEIGLAMAK